MAKKKKEKSELDLYTEKMTAAIDAIKIREEKINSLRLRNNHAMIEIDKKMKAAIYESKLLENFEWFIDSYDHDPMHFVAGEFTKKQQKLLKQIWENPSKLNSDFYHIQIGEGIYIWPYPEVLSKREKDYSMVKIQLCDTAHVVNFLEKHNINLRIGHPTVNGKSDARRSYLSAVKYAEDSRTFMELIGKAIKYEKEKRKEEEFHNSKS